jgi:peptidoglycan hydrolase CwlO-like protein
MDPLEEKKLLEEELKKLEEEISQYESNISSTQQKKKTLQNQIYILKSKIEKLNLEIYKSNVMIGDLSLQIGDTTDSIEKTSVKIQDSQAKLGALLRAMYEEDSKSLIEILLAEEKISTFFTNLVALESLNLRTQELLGEIKNQKLNLESQKQALDEEKNDLEELVIINQLQKQESEGVKYEQEYILQQTKGEEAKYQELLEVTKEKAAEIRARIFELIGVPEAPTFGEALEMAKYVESVTGVRPAFLLAVLTQESNIGKNVGQCYLKNPSTGAGIVIYSGKSLSNVMKPSRDVGPFLEITKELGRDPYSTPVSCPMSFGWGGAMGPAQFIPSTWMIYREEAKQILGVPADPWNIRDAFLAAALYLGDYGAKNQTYNSEWKAAMIYFSGSTNTRYRFYGDSVMAITAQYEQDIAAIEKN